jgi:hypothetical protein
MKDSPGKRIPMPEEYRKYVHFLMEHTEAEAVVLIIIDGKDGSGGAVAAHSMEVIPRVQDVLETVLDEIKDKLKKSSN